jgi:polyisoprenoid-binding protein YceI
MSRRLGIQVALGSVLALTIYFASGTAAKAQAPVAIDSARITIDGTSNIHAYTASTSTIRLTRGQLGNALAGPDVWTDALKPGAVDGFEIAIPSATLTSPKDGLDKNMHKALKVTEHPDITFRLIRLEASSGAPGAIRGIGVLKVAGVERQVALNITTERKNLTLRVQGQLQLLMTDFGIKPPTAMLGMLKTDPKVTVTFETALTVPST